MAGSVGNWAKMSAPQEVLMVSVRNGLSVIQVRERPPELQGRTLRFPWHGCAEAPQSGSSNNFRGLCISLSGAVRAESYAGENRHLLSRPHNRCPQRRPTLSRLWRPLAQYPAHGSIRKYLRQSAYQRRGEVLIEEKLHAGIELSRRSRFAAKARLARMSSDVRSGKSVKISACDIPEAR